jgi:hypothetical protein
VPAWSQFSWLIIVRPNLGEDRRTIGITVLRLYHRDGLRCPSCTAGYSGEQQDATAGARLVGKLAAGYVRSSHKFVHLRLGDGAVAPRRHTMQRAPATTQNGGASYEALRYSLPGTPA